MASTDSTMTEKASDFLTYLQQLEFACADSTSMDPSQQADVLRNLYLHLQRSSCLAGNSNRTLDTPSLWMIEAYKYLNEYATVADKIEANGLNNFAEGSLALCKYYTNESTEWKTSLKVDTILQIAQQSCSNHKDHAAVIPEDYIINLHEKPSTDSISSVLEQGLYTSTIHTPTLPASREPAQKPWVPNQQTPVLSPGYSTGHKPHLNIPTSNSPFSSDVSYRNTNCPKSQGQYNESLKQPITMRMGAVTGNIMGAPQDQTVHAFPGLHQNYERGLQQMTSSNLFSKNSQQSHGNKLMMDEDHEERGDYHNNRLPFRTAKEQLIINQQKKCGGGGGVYDRSQVLGASYRGGKKSLGTRRGPQSKFVPPVLNRDSYESDSPVARGANSSHKQSHGAGDLEEPLDERLKGIEPKMIELINHEIMDRGTPVLWTDIAGLEFAKKTIKEIVVWPMLRPDIFTGLRGPPKGLLLFGPPGTGKTLIGKCIASQSKSTFFCISASSLTSKWVGEGEKMVRALFAVARCNQPAVIFIDEIDSLLSQRSDAEHESSRRIKTEFLVQLDGAATNSDDRILVIGATNRPQEIDEAARRRFVKRLLIPLPEAIARSQIIRNLMSQQTARLTEEDIQAIVDKTEGYSGADMTNLCREAALGPIRSIPFEMMETVTPDQVRPVMYEDFEGALLQVRASVSSKDLQLYTDWNQTYGSFGL
ncbi:hypothetical protein BsWGS_26999 [Bradybaena similaris]